MPVYVYYMFVCLYIYNYLNYLNSHYMKWPKCPLTSKQKKINIFIMEFISVIKNMRTQTMGWNFGGYSQNGDRPKYLPQHPIPHHQKTQLPPPISPSSQQKNDSATLLHPTKKSWFWIFPSKSGPGWQLWGLLWKGRGRYSFLLKATEDHHHNWHPLTETIQLHNSTLSYCQVIKFVSDPSSILGCTEQAASELLKISVSQASAIESQQT